MYTQVFYIRNMVSTRCIRSVSDAIKNCGAQEEEKTTLGKAVISYEAGKFRKEILQKRCAKMVLNLIENKDETSC